MGTNAGTSSTKEIMTKYPTEQGSNAGQDHSKNIINLVAETRQTQIIDRSGLNC